MKIYVCKERTCGKGAIIIADELKLPKTVTNVKVISGKQVLSLFIAKAAVDNKCPNCGIPIRELEKPKAEPITPIKRHD